ncbi:protein SIX6OS1, partial [Pempheris klunzingeri]|uniref:protein SIX6OS1 n=1 Tax=Pempheris klunzingeri TaxID=3127111 RepID=UPI00398135A6
LALQIRELSQKKNEINEQIKVCRADIAEWRSYIDTIHRNTRALEEEIRVKQSTVIHNKANAKSMKATNSLLLQYKQTLKEELESRKASYNQDMEVYEERIASYWKIFQSHKEYYCQNPLAQKLFTLQAEKEEIESRIKACDYQITVKQKEVDHLTGNKFNSSSTENLTVSVFSQQPITEAEKPLGPQIEEDSDSSIDISSLHLSQTKQMLKKFMRNKGSWIQPPAAPSQKKMVRGGNRIFISSEQRWPDMMHTEEQHKKTGPDDQEQPSAVSDTEEAVEEEKEERVVIEEEQAPGQEDNKGLTAFPQSSSQETNPLSSPTTVKAVPSTPTFPFTFSPGSSPHQGTSNTNSPAFLFSLNSNAGTPTFSGFGFGFDAGSSQDEDPSFTFFDEKKTTESKSPSCPEFLFGQSEQSEDFQFVFTSKSPQTAKKDNNQDEFPFSFNF